MGASVEKVDLAKPLTDLGVDSLMAVELKNWVEGELRVTVPIAEVIQGPSVDRLTDILLDQLYKSAGPTAPGTAQITAFDLQAAQAGQKPAEAQPAAAAAGGSPSLSEIAASLSKVQGQSGSKPTFSELAASLSKSQGQGGGSPSLAELAASLSKGDSPIKASEAGANGASSDANGHDPEAVGAGDANGNGHEASDAAKTAELLKNLEQMPQGEVEKLLSSMKK
jgi:hypothetical protein